VDDLFDLAADLWRATNAGASLRLIGGLAVRLVAGETARVTRDIDVVTMTSECEHLLLDHLRARGFRVGDTGGWHRATQSGPPLRIVDIARHPLVDVRTFDSHGLHAAPRTFEASGASIVTAGVADLVRLKLAAARDQDLVDLLLLARAGDVTAKAVASAAEVDDTERRISAGAHHARFAVESGMLAGLAEEILDRPPSSDETAALRALLGDLEKEGL
jgi:hypothetical protein